VLRIDYHMSSVVRRLSLHTHKLAILACCATLVSAAILGYRPSLIGLGVIIGLVGLVLLLRKPLIGLLLLIIVALVGPIAIGTGTEVNLNLAALLVPALFVIWLLTRMNQHNVRFNPSPTTRPMILFLALALLSVFISNLIWDPTVPRSSRFIVVQFAQVGLFAFSAGAFWLVGNMIQREVWLRRLTAAFLIVGGALAIIQMLPRGPTLLLSVATFAMYRAPFWVLLTAVTAGQLMFNRDLPTLWRIYLIIILVAIFSYSFGDQQERTSNWLGVAIVLGVLLWLRLPKWRWLAVSALVVLTASGVLFQALYNFAGGDAKWEESGGSRQVLIQRVLEVSMRNPITGIGPAAYRAYGGTRPLQYQRAYWLTPVINSHNNYVDLFSQTGIIGLALFLWFMLELLRVAWKLRARYRDGFAGGYVAAMLSVWLSIMVIMALADWFLPFVYNIGFPGFQASVLVWMFLGGLLSLEHLSRQPVLGTHHD
jgi:O-antigen ligase